jgi:DNA-3-methyladenine glycosylase I
MKRCGWAADNDFLLREYHDNEYGKLKSGDVALFEKLCLECFQAGLSWRTVLYKREALRQCFFDFEPQKVAEMTQDDISLLMDNRDIIRNRRKIEAVINNARTHLKEFSEEGTFTNYVYSCKDGVILSDDLKRRGYRFAGPVICESFLMSVGAMEGHEEGCSLFGTSERI